MSLIHKPVVNKGRRPYELMLCQKEAHIKQGTIKGQMHKDMEL